ncbi:MAG: lipopolysaccharide kinase InaA family protein [Planctomycetota bacterium]
MRAPELTLRLPERYVVERSGANLCALHRDAHAALRAAGYGADSARVYAASRLSGRRPLYEIATPDGVFLLRRFSHGGLLRFLTRARFADPMRPFRELCISAALREAGFHTPEVVAARARALTGGGFELEIVTRRVEHARDLGFVLAAARRGEIDARARRGLCTAVGTLVRRLHDTGFLHADLMPNNLLVEDAELARATPRVWLLDLDRTRRVAAASPAERHTNLERFVRFVVRREEKLGRALARTDLARFFRSYEPDGRRWKDTARAVLALVQRRSGLHRAGGWLEASFAKRRDPREGAV